MIQIATNNEILIDYKATGFRVHHGEAMTEVYSVRTGAPLPMSRGRYSLTHPKPASGIPGCDEFEAEIRAAIAGHQV